MMNVSERSVTNCKCFRIPIGICLKASFQFVFRLIFGYVSSFFFKFWYFVLCFVYIFVNCNIFCSNIIINFYFFLLESVIFNNFCLYFYIFGCSIISCNYKTTKIFGGAHVCVFGLFYRHVFSLRVFNIFFFYPNQQTKLIEGVVVLGLDADKPCSNFSYQTNYFLGLYGLDF